jgi:acyl-coenzyme A thioesterase PaaI-like protein
MERPHFETLVAMYDSAPINKWFQPRLRIPEKGRAAVEMAVREDFHHAARAIHGAVYFKALDVATFFALQSVVTDFFVGTSSFPLYFLRPFSDGHPLARGQVVSRSKRLYIAEGIFFVSRGKEVARATGTVMPSAIQLGPELGYR